LILSVNFSSLNGSSSSSSFSKLFLRATSFDTFKHLSIGFPKPYGSSEASSGDPAIITAYSEITKQNLNYIKKIILGCQ